MITFSKTIEDIKADYKRRMQLEEKPINVWSFVCVFFKPGMLNVLFYRLSRYCFHHRIPVVCKLAIVLSQVINSTEIAPQADIGPGLYIENSGGVGIPASTSVGKNCTFFGCAVITLGALSDAPDAQDYIALGDYCVMGGRSRIMRPINLANGTQVKPLAVVISSTTKEGQIVAGVPAKRKSVEDYALIQNWNPVLGKMLKEAT